MKEPGPNRLVLSLGDFVGSRLLDEKWLIAPTRRIGFQWLDAVTRSGLPVLNVHVKTLQTLALDLAMPVVDGGGLAFLRGLKAELLVDRVFTRLKESGRAGYLSSLEASAGLTRTLSSAIRDLRLAGLVSKELRPGDFEVSGKGAEIVALLALYENELREGGLVDYGEVLRTAAARLRDDESALPADAVVVMPVDLEESLRGLERSFWHSFPAERRVIIETDRAAEPGTRDGPGDDTERADSGLLKWIRKPLDAPAPKADGTAKVFRAVGEVNEVREVLRRCAEAQVPFDQVEILHTDGTTYVPLIYEIVSSIKACEWDEMPVTFAEGVPARYSRPARALMGWLSWMIEDYPQSTLVRMIQDGLLSVPRVPEEGQGFAGMAAGLKAVPIGNGSERYVPAIDRALASLEEEAGACGNEEDEDVAAAERRRARALSRVTSLEGVRGLVSVLLAGARAFGTGQRAGLEAAAALIESTARCVNEFDEYARGRLLEEIKELADFIDGEDVAGLNLWDWLMELARSAQVGGLGPRPGRIYVAPAGAGGHSGRPFTFILGLDDARFPGTGRQDPLLLDAERSKVSPELPTGRGRLADNIDRFEGLLARLRGTVTLSYCCRNLSDDREVFPGPVVLSAYRVLSGNRSGDMDDLLRWLPEPASFAPAAPGRCVDETEWWLWRMCGDEAVESAEAVIRANFPHLGKGMEARRARESDAFTEYDGYVPEAGEDIDPTKPEGRPLSASALERLGACPMEFFFSHVLGIEVPDEYEVGEARWLDQAQKGELLHDVFREFMSGIRKRGFPPRRERDAEFMREVLDRRIDSWKVDIVPPSLDVFERDVRELESAADIFLKEEERLCRDTPEYFEVAIGLPAEGAGTPLDTGEPVEIALADGSSIRARGRIDRADVLAGADDVFTIIDYKTGRAYGYDQADPFRQGRRVQSLVYLKLFQARLDRVMPGARAGAFRYFFPGVREHGERFEWTCGELACGERVLSLLCEMIKTGCFPFTNDADDAKYSDYADAFGDREAAAEAMKRKLSNASNTALEPFRKLREGESGPGTAGRGASRGRR